MIKGNGHNGKEERQRQQQEKCLEMNRGNAVTNSRVCEFLENGLHKTIDNADTGPEIITGLLPLDSNHCQAKLEGGQHVGNPTTMEHDDNSDSCNDVSGAKAISGTNSEVKKHIISTKAPIDLARTTNFTKTENDDTTAQQSMTGADNLNENDDEKFAELDKSMLVVGDEIEEEVREDLFD